VPAGKIYEAKERESTLEELRRAQERRKIDMVDDVFREEEDRELMRRLHAEEERRLRRPVASAPVIHPQENPPSHFTIIVNNKDEEKPKPIQGRRAEGLMRKEQGRAFRASLTEKVRDQKKSEVRSKDLQQKKKEEIDKERMIREAVRKAVQHQHVKSEPVHQHVKSEPVEIKSEPDFYSKTVNSDEEKQPSVKRKAPLKPGEAKKMKSQGISKK